MKYHPVRPVGNAKVLRFTSGFVYNSGMCLNVGVSGWNELFDRPGQGVGSLGRGRLQE